MARQVRKKSESGIYHIMLRGINRQQIFEDEERDKGTVLLSLFLDNKRRRGTRGRFSCPFFLTINKRYSSIKQGDVYGSVTDSYTFTGNSAQIASHSIAYTGYNKTFSYTYDDNGNIISVSDGTNTVRYVYDSANQLIRENNQAGNFTYVWTYDDAGNILSRTEYAYTIGTLGTPLDTATYTYGDSQWGDLLTAYDGSTITCDAIGNPLGDGTWTYTWEHGRELASMSDGSTTWSYTYDANGMRTEKTDGTNTYRYIYVDGQLVKMNVGANECRFAYDAQGRPLTVLLEDGSYYFYITNLQGDVIGLVDSTGAIQVQYTYDAWGNILSISGAKADTLGTLNPLRYRGYVYDNETGLYYVSSRYYDPEIGRWINADSVIAGIGENVLGYNMFAYCFNNPVNMSDPTGNWPKWLSGALNVVGGALQVAAGAALGATVGWTGFGAVAAGFLIVNGTATAAQGVGQIVNHVTNSNVMREDNIVRTGVQEVGRAIGGDTGAKIAGGAYDVAVVAANLYAVKVGLQQAGKLPIKVNINNVVNNPLDEFVTIGPADGVIQQYCRTIPQSGYGKIYATQLGNGLYQIANGHHRVAALRALGYETIKIFLTK